MGHMVRHQITITTASGSATAYIPVSGKISGKIHSIHYVKDDYAAGVDFAITSEATGESIWSENDVNASSTIYPRRSVQDPSDQSTNVEYSTDGSLVREIIAIANDRIKFAITQASGAQSGTFHVVMET